MVPPDPLLRERLRQAFTWSGDRGSDASYADLTGLWRDSELLAGLGPALAALVDVRPTVVLGTQSRGALLGAVASLALGVGLVEVRKNPRPAADSDPWLRTTTPSDYKERQLVLGFRKQLLQSNDRVLLVDDWIATGAQALAVQTLVEQAGATWVGAAVVVDALSDNRIRRQLQVHGLLREREL